MIIKILNSSALSMKMTENANLAEYYIPVCFDLDTTFHGDDITKEDINPHIENKREDLNSIR
jgi:hypothetical protein